MGKVLRVFVVFMFLLSVGALVLGVLLFNQREQLKGRTQRLEQTLIMLGPTIEAEGAEVDTKPDYPARDIDETVAELIDDPQKSDFWESYSHELELTDQVAMDVAKDKDQLMHYYKIDPVTGKPEKAMDTGLKITSGPGTMQDILDGIVKKSEDQLNRLNETRHQLRKVREELIDTVTELNTKKSDLRQALTTIVDKERSITQLEDKIRTLEGTIEEKDDQIRMLKDSIEEQKTTIAERDEEIVDLNSEIKVLKDEIERLRGRIDPGVVTRVLQHLTRGYKGSIAAVNDDWNFVLLKFTDEFMGQLSAELAKGKGTPQVDLLVKRQGDGGTETFVTKVKLNHIRAAENIGVADILTGWQQTPLQEGDRVYY